MRPNGTVEERDSLEKKKHRENAGKSRETPSPKQGFLWIIWRRRLSLRFLLHASSHHLSQLLLFLPHLLRFLKVQQHGGLALEHGASHAGNPPPGRFLSHGPLSVIGIRLPVGEIVEGSLGCFNDVPGDKRRALLSTLFGTFETAFPFQHGPSLETDFREQSEDLFEVDLPVSG